MGGSQAEEEVKAGGTPTKGSETMSHLVRYLVLGLGLIVPSTISIAVSVESNSMSRWALFAGCALVLGCVAGLRMMKDSEAPMKKAMFGALATGMGLGAAVWLALAQGMWSYDSAFRAMTAGDYERAEIAFGRAAARAASPGLSIYRLEDGSGARIGTEGLVLYAEWDAISWQAVAMYGTGNADAARRLMRTAIDRARAIGAGEGTLDNLEADLGKMSESGE